MLDHLLASEDIGERRGCGMAFKRLAVVALLASWLGAPVAAQPLVTEADLVQGCANLKSMSSGVSQTAIQVSFVNKTSGSVVVNWIDFHGLPQLAKSLPPGGDYVQRTYVRHAFLIADAAGKCLGAFTAWQSQNLEIHEPPPTNGSESTDDLSKALLRTLGAPVALLALGLAVAAGIRLLALLDGRTRRSADADAALEAQTRIIKPQMWLGLALSSASACLLVGVPAALAWRDHYGSWRPDTPTTVPPMMLVLPPPPRQPRQPVEGVWDVTVVCPNGGKISERNTLWRDGRLSHEFIDSDGLTGRTELALGYLADGVLVLRGHLSFGSSGFERIEGVARQQQGTYYRGSATMGTSPKRCEFLARQPT